MLRLTRVVKRSLTHKVNPANVSFLDYHRGKMKERRSKEFQEKSTLHKGVADVYKYGTYVWGVPTGLLTGSAVVGMLGSELPALLLSAPVGLAAGVGTGYLVGNLCSDLPFMGYDYVSYKYQNGALGDMKGKVVGMKDQLMHARDKYIKDFFNDRPNVSGGSGKLKKTPTPVHAKKMDKKDEKF